MKTLFATLLLFAGVAAALPRWSAEEDSEESSVEVPAPPSSAAGSQPARAEVAKAPPADPSGADTQTLVSGAPLYNPNVSVHIVEKKEFSDRHRNEIVVYPLALQTN